MTNNNNPYNNIIYPAYRLFMDHNIELVYQGEISSSTADALINIFEYLFHSKGAPVKIQKRAFYILVEAMQNVVRHQVLPEKPLPRSSGALLFQYINGHFIFTLKNLVENNNVRNIRKKIDSLNALGKEELNKYYKKILKNEVLSDKGGAGLGLIEIARKSENVISYEFLRAGDQYSWFFFNIMVADRGKEQEIPVGEGIPVAKELHRLLAGPSTWFVLREEYPAMFPAGLRNHVAGALGFRYEDTPENKFHALLDNFPELCTAVSVIQQSSGKKPCLIYFVNDPAGLSVFSGMPVSIPSSDRILSFFNALFSGKLNESSMGTNSGFDPDTLEKLSRFSGYPDKPPRIILQDISPGEKFILLKFTFQ